MLTIETDQGPFLLKVTPTKAHFRSGTAAERCWNALEDHGCKSIEINTVLQGFLKVAQNGGEGDGLTDRAIAVWLEFPAPCGCGPCRRQRAVGPQPMIQL